MFKKIKEKFKRRPVVYISYNELANDVQFVYPDNSNRFINATYNNCVNIDKIRQETKKLTKEGYRVKFKKDILSSSYNEINIILQQQEARLSTGYYFYTLILLFVLLILELVLLFDIFFGVSYRDFIYLLFITFLNDLRYNTRLKRGK